MDEFVRIKLFCVKTFTKYLIRIDGAGIYQLYKKIIDKHFLSPFLRIPYNSWKKEDESLP